MKYEYITYDVVAESDIIELEEHLVSAVIVVSFKVIQDEKEYQLPILKEQIVVINNNKQTGFEMDAQREKESEEFVNSLND